MVSRRLSYSNKYTIAFLVWQLYLAGAVSGELVVSPKDTEASIGERIELACTSTVDAIEWHHLRPGTNIPEIVYKDGYIFNGYRGRFDAKQCTSTGGECRLVIMGVNVSDAGNYICVENSEEPVQKEAQLIVYEQYPSTQFCIGMITCSPKCSTLELSCNMKYNGNIDAFMEWRDSAGELVPSSISTANGITTSTVQFKQDHLESPSCTCRVKYPTTNLESRYNWAPKSEDFMASSKPQHEWNQQVTILVTILVSAIVVLFVIIIGLTVTIQLIRRRHRRRRNLSNTCPEINRTHSEDAMQQLTEQQTTLMNNENGPTQSEDVMQKSLEQETPLTNNEIDPELDESSLTEGEISPRTKANKNQAIHGLSVIDDEVFIVTREGCIIEVFDLNAFKFKRAFSVAGLVNPSDMVSCPKIKRLYICDWKKSADDTEIVCADKHGTVKIRWISENDKGRLSITRDSHIIVAESWYNTIKEYSSDGQLIRKLQTCKQKLHLWHAIKLLNGYFVASFGDRQDELQDVCVLDDQGNEIRSFSKTSALSINPSMTVPRTLAVDGHGTIYVADLYNGRIIVLTSELHVKGELNSTTTRDILKGPLRIFLHELNDKRQLLVADSMKENKKWVDGKIVIIDIEN